MLLVKYDGETKDVRWTRLWGYFQSEYATALAINPSGDILMAGNTTSLDPAGETDIVLLTWSPSGELLAARAWGREGYSETVAALAVDATGVTIGGTLDPGDGTDALVVRLDGSGNQRWARTSGILGPDGFAAVLAGTGGDVVVAGTLAGGGTGDQGLLACFDATGALLWDRAWSETPSRIGALSLAGGLLVIGGGAEMAAGGWQSGIVSPQPVADCGLTPEGYLINTPVSSLLFPTGVGQAPTGYTEDTGGGDYDALLLRYTPGSTI